MKQVKSFIVTVIVAAVVSLLIFAFVKPRQNGENTAKESIYERVVRTNTIRCGYAVYPPYLIKDPNTGKLSGIFYDLTEKMGQLLNVKIEWTHETTFGTFIEDMKVGRFDAFCSDVWPEAGRSRQVLFTIPVNYTVMGVYVRSDDTRFDNAMMLLNDKAYSFSTLDGEMSSFVTQEDFPNAKILSHTNNTDYSQLMIDVVTKKADAIIVEKAVTERYMEKNPGVLKNITADRPIRFFGNTWATLHGNADLIAMMNTTLAQMINTGYVDKTVSKYDPGMNNVYPIALPFQQPHK